MYKNIHFYAAIIVDHSIAFLFTCVVLIHVRLF